MDKEKRNFIIGLIIVVLLILGIYYAFKPDRCQDYECFRQHMVECNPAKYINEEREASWGYEVRGKVGNQCDVRVTLLMAKEGELKLTKFEGDYMDCYYPLGTAAFPDEDLGACTGVLKEDLQQRIIEKLHEYVLDNIGEIRGELGV